MDYSCTLAEETLLGTLEGLLKHLEEPGASAPKALDGLKVLVAGNRSGLLPCALAKGGADVTVHVFDCHHARAIRERLDAADLAGKVRVAIEPGIPSGPYARAYFMTTPQSMTGELVLDQLEDIRTNLSAGGELVAAFEGDADESLKTMKKAFARVHVEGVVQNRKRRRNGGRRLETVALFRAVKGEADAAAKRRSFIAEWNASVPGGEARAFVSLPGCFCHRRADMGGLALAETACSVLEDLKGAKILDMGCGCGFVGLLVADRLRARGTAAHLTLLDSHARALEAARMNAERLGFADARLVLSDIGTAAEDDASFDLFLGNPPYFGDWRIAETFVSTAFRALRPGGRCLTVAKSEGGLGEIQSRIFGNAAILRRRGYCVFSSIRH